MLLLPYIGICTAGFFQAKFREVRRARAMEYLFSLHELLFALSHLQWRLAQSIFYTVVRTMSG